MFLHELHYLLLMGFSHSNRTIVRRTGAQGLLPGQPKILGALTAYDGCTQMELAQVCALDKSTVTSVLSRMVAQGLVRKEACADDRRAARIYLTKSGRQQAQAVAEIFHAVDARALAGISEADRAQFLRTFSAIIQNLNTLEGEET